MRKKAILMTQFLSIHQKNPEKRHIKTATEILDSGGIILAPSETGYCFIGDASRESTHTRFLQLRPGHPKNKPFSLLCRNISQVSQMANLSTQIFRIATRVWPGPYTFILQCNKNTPKIAAGPKRKTVGIRISNHPVLINILEEFKNPLLVTSVTDEDELIAQDYFSEENQHDSWWINVTEICNQITHGKVDLALENDEVVPIHVSAVIDFSGNEPLVVREGGWDLEILGIG